MIKTCKQHLDIYINQGLKIFPLWENTKEPIIKWKSCPKLSKEELLKYNTENFGWVLGENDLIIDIH